MHHPSLEAWSNGHLYLLIIQNFQFFQQRRYSRSYNGCTFFCLYLILVIFFLSNPFTAKFLQISYQISFFLFYIYIYFGLANLDLNVSSQMFHTTVMLFRQTTLIVGVGGMPWPKKAQLITMHSWDFQTEVVQSKSWLSVGCLDRIAPL